MKQLGWMLAAGIGTWLAIALGSRSFNPEVFFGMLGPLVGAAVSWLVTARTARTAPERVTAVMTAGLGVKMLFFAAYTIGMLRGAGLAPIPFVVSFAAYFVGLFVMQAWFLKRLFEEGPRPVRG